jgi:hypothetical protein|tara:strand:- start:161 stop:535 length:375 start_codon:yes stop_codon:yes gene_type:complete
MRYFAKIGLNNKVVAVFNVHENELKDVNDVEHEDLGIQFLNRTLGNGVYVQCWKDHSKRKHMAGVGMTYRWGTNEDKDAFIPMQPFPSWTLNNDTCNWEAPFPRPDDGKFYDWNEETTSWDLVE